MWKSTPAPATPEEASPEFVAHSVVMTQQVSLLHARHYRWQDLTDGAAIDDSFAEKLGAVRTGAAIDLCTLAPSIASDGSTSLVFLGSGTVIRVDPEHSSAFAGFTAPGSRYAIPIHRFAGGADQQRRYAAQMLLHAERRYREAAAAHPKRIIDDAYDTLELTGYPRAGMDGSDANVVAFWRPVPPRA